MEFKYELKRSLRKTLSVEVQSDGNILVRAPKTYPKYKIEAFLKEKHEWIREKVEIQKRREMQAEKVSSLSEAEEKLYRQQAREVFALKTDYYAKNMGVAYGRISIRDQKTRWGSCSAEGNLNFNWRLVMAPAGVLDYVVVHELAHRKEMNHSAAFWEVVEETMPEYKKYRKWLKENGQTLHRY